MPGQFKRFQNYFSRSAVKARQNLGIILGSERTQIKKVRNKELELYDSYYEGTQYAKLPPWDEANARDGEFIPVRKRQPRIIYNLAQVMVNRIAAKLVGSDGFPTLKVEDDPDTDIFIGFVVKAAKLRVKLMDTVKLMCLSGSSLLRFYIVEGSLMAEAFHSKHCYPVFKANGELESVRIQYVYEDENDKDSSTNKPKEKWYRMDLTASEDILYDNPEYRAEGEPTFQPVASMKHDLGFVQAEWFRTSEDKHSPDGISLIKDILDFVDELNYSLSQSSQAIGYGQEPQLGFSGMDVDEIDKVVKSSTTAWNLGRDGKAAFVETRLDGVKTAMDMRDKIRLAIQDVARVVLLDPEKIAGHAQSGKAMEVLHGPFVELINELRPQIEDRIASLATKMAVTILEMNDRGQQTSIMIPAGYQPQSLNISVHWPPIFPMTMDDLLQKSNIAQIVTRARVISEATITEWLAKDFGVENIDEELAKIKAQPVINPFGSFGGGGE